MAYLPAYVLHIASGRGSGSESNAGTAATLHDPCDLGYLHSGGDSRQAYSPHRSSLADYWKWRIEAGLGHEGERSAPWAQVERKHCNRVIGELCAEFDASRGICTFLCPRENSSTGVS